MCMGYKGLVLESRHSRGGGVCSTRVRKKDREKKTKKEKIKRVCATTLPRQECVNTRRKRNRRLGECGKKEKKRTSMRKRENKEEQECLLANMLLNGRVDRRVPALCDSLL